MTDGPIMDAFDESMGRLVDLQAEAEMLREERDAAIREAYDLRQALALAEEHRCARCNRTLVCHCSDTTKVAEYADPDDMVPGEAYNAVLAENDRLRMAGAGLNTMLTDAHNEIERLRAQVVSTREAWMADPFGHGGEG